MKGTFLVLFFIIAYTVSAQFPLIKHWDYRYGGNDYDELFTFQQTRDAGYILGGRSKSGNNGDKTEAARGQGDFWVIKIDSMGIKQWDKTFGGDRVDALHSLQQTTDDGYILGGISYSGMNGDKTQKNWDSTSVTSDYWVIKIDSQGTKQWDKTFGGIGLDQLFSIKQSKDQGYILGGQSASVSSGDKTQNNWSNYFDYWIVKIDSTGNKCKIHLN